MDGQLFIGQHIVEGNYFGLHIRQWLGLLRSMCLLELSHYNFHLSPFPPQKSLSLLYFFNIRVYLPLFSMDSFYVLVI